MTEIHGSIPAGERVGDYQIVGKIGAGGMGVVYKAVDLKLDRTVALKFLPHDLGAGPAEKERFLREAKTASSLDHTNIGVIHGIEETADGQLFIVMAYYEGETLAHKIRSGPLGTIEALDLAIQIARGLGEAHSRKIIHRDIKPSNVIITRQGIAKIVDFGLARMVATSSATQSIGLSGTVGYMSPEQAMNKPLDQRTDLWALGVTLAEMLTGRNPFHRESPGAMMLAILHQPPTGFQDQPSELQAILYRALAKDTANRYASAEEMLADLERVRASLSPASPVQTESGAQTLSLGSKGSRQTRELEKYLERASGSSELFAPAKKRKWLLWVAIAAAIMVVASASLLIPALRNHLLGGTSGASTYHVAVLPFQTIGGGASDTLVAEGLMQSLTGKLSNLDVGKQSLWVVPASVVLARKVNDPTSALRDLGATVVVQGMIEREGQDVHLTVNLIDTKTLRQIGSAQFEDPAGDLSTLQNEAVSRLANLMGITMTPAMLEATGGRVQPVAYESYLRALGYLQRYDKSGNIEAAISALQTATNTDPQFALGYAELGEAYRLRYATDKNPQWIDEVTANCNRALQLDDHLPVIYVTLGKLHTTLGKYDLATQEFQHALSLNRNDSDAELGLARNYESAGRIADAEAAYKRAVALRPNYWDGYNTLGAFYFRQRRYQDALAQFQRVIQLTPDNAQAYNNLGGIYQLLGKLPEAERAFEKSISIAPSYPAYANLGVLFYNDKRYAESASMTEKALQFNDKDFRLWANLALAYQWLKENSKAQAADDKEFELLQAAVKLQPNDAGLHSALATLYAGKKEEENAMLQLRNALALAPDDPGVLADVADAYEELGNRSQAIRYMEKSLKKGYPLEYLKGNPAMRGLLADPNFHPTGK